MLLKSSEARTCKVVHQCYIPKSCENTLGEQKNSFKEIPLKYQVLASIGALSKICDWIQERSNNWFQRGFVQIN